jgi:F0F1-type ATP synthase assembly protein I
LIYCLSVSKPNTNSRLKPCNLERPHNSGKANPGDRPFWIQIARYSQLAFILPSATVVGWIVGLAFDQWLHTSWLYLAGLLVGIVAGFVELLRTARPSDSK